MASQDSIQQVEKLAESLEVLSEPSDLFILLVDLCGSTAIKQFCIENQIPDSVWITRQKVFLARSATIVRSYGGNVVKTIGDELMAYFTAGVKPKQIIRCSIEIFQNFNGLKSYNKGRFIIRSKSSIDFGTCYDGQLLSNDVLDPIGTCVDRCSRLNDLGNPNEIILSLDFMDILKQNNVRIDKYHVSEEQAELQGIGTVKYYRISTEDTAHSSKSGA